MNGEGKNECPHYLAFPTFKGQTEERLKDLEGRMDYFKKEGKERGDKLEKLEKDHARFGAYRAVILAVVIPLLTFLIQWAAKAVLN